MARGTRKRTRKGISKKANIQRRETSEGNTKRYRKQTEKRSSTKRSDPQRIRERRGGKSCLIWVFSYVKAQKNSNLFSQSSFDTRFSLQFKLRFGKTVTFAFIALKPSRQFIARITFQSVRILKIISCPTFWNV